MLCFLEHLECGSPLLAPHIHHTQVSVGLADLRIARDDAAKSLLGRREIPLFESRLSLFKELTNFGSLGGRGRRLGSIALLSRALRAGIGDQQKGQHQPNPDRSA